MLLYVNITPVNCWQFLMLTMTYPVNRLYQIFQIFDVRKSAAVLVRVESKYDATQHISLILRNGFLKLVVSLHSYFVERVSFTNGYLI